MKKFILSITLLICGVLILCSTLIAEGLVVGGYNTSEKGFAYGLFSLGDNSTSLFFLIMGLLMFFVGLVISIIFIKEKKN